mgnify:CR=1 FL=1
MKKLFALILALTLALALLPVETLPRRMVEQQERAGILQSLLQRECRKP